MECILNQVDPQFDVAQAAGYRLSVLLCHDGFSFLVTHLHSKKVLSLSEYKWHRSDRQTQDSGSWVQQAKEYFDKFRTLDYSRMLWQDVRVAVASQKITVVPHAFIDGSNEINLMSAVHPVLEGEKLVLEPLYEHGPVTAALVPAFITENCAALFPGMVLRNASAVFVKGIFRWHSQILSRQVFINLHPDFFEIAVTEGLRLLYLNTFKFSSPSDVLYYVIFVLEQLGFVPSEEKVTLMGDVSSNSTIFVQLKMYCGALDFISDVPELVFSESFAEVQQHKYFTLLNIPLCE